MVTIEVKNIGGNTILPVAGSERAAGYDVVAIDDPIIIGEIGNVKEVNGVNVAFYRSIDYLEYHTALFISPQTYIQGTDRIQNWPCHTLIHPRSSIRKYNLVLANSIGLIDNDYRGEIMICYKYTWQPDDLVLETEKVPVSDGGTDFTWEMTGRMLGKINYDKIFKKGDKIAQLVIEPTTFATFVLVNELDKTERGEGGFGSTDPVPPSPRPPPYMTMPSGTGKYEELKTQEENGPSTISERYQKAGGVPIKKKYIDEIREREHQAAKPASAAQVQRLQQKTGITERKA